MVSYHNINVTDTGMDGSQAPYGANHSVTPGCPLVTTEINHGEGAITGV